MGLVWNGEGEVGVSFLEEKRESLLSERERRRELHRHKARRPKCKKHAYGEGKRLPGPAWPPDLRGLI